MTITTGAINVGSHGLTATLTDTANEYSGHVSYYRIDDARDNRVGTVRIVEATTDRVYAHAYLPGAVEVTTDWLDLFNKDAGDRDEHTALNRAADAIAAAKGT